MPTMTTLVRTARPDEYDRVRELYEAWGYRGRLQPSDTVYVAEQGDALIGVVRRSPEQGTQVLRGLYVVPSMRKQGVGMLLLEHFVQELPDGECWCVPYANMQGFFGRGGFRVVPTEMAPAFLRERVEFYRADGLDVVLMRRG